MSTEKTTKEIGFTVTFGGKTFIVLYVILSALYIIPVSSPVQGMSWKWIVAPLAVYLVLRALWKVIAFWIKRNVTRRAQIAEMRKTFKNDLDRTVSGQ